MLNYKEDNNRIMKIRPTVGKLQQKLLLVLMGGIAFGLSHSPRQQVHILKELRKEWKMLSNQQFSRSIASLRKQGLISCKEKDDGTLTVRLSRSGRSFSQLLNIKKLEPIIPGIWDSHWHIVTFDIPIDKNSARDSFRFHLKRLGFIEWQRSVFVSPYNAREIIDTVAALHDVYDGVAYIEALNISNEVKLKRHFKLK